MKELNISFCLYHHPILKKATEIWFREGEPVEQCLNLTLVINTDLSKLLLKPDGTEKSPGSYHTIRVQQCLLSSE